MSDPTKKPKFDDSKSFDTVAKPAFDEKAAYHVPEQEQEKSRSVKEGLVQGAIDAIPVATGLAGGVVGTAIGPIGTAGGAGLGYAAGRELQDLANHYVQGTELPDNSPLAATDRVLGNTAVGAVSAGAFPVGAATGQISKAITRKAIVSLEKLPPLAKDALAYSAGYAYDKLRGNPTQGPFSSGGLEGFALRRLGLRR